jgi:hypothetical protein
MPKKRNDLLMESLALAVSTGGKIAPWARKNGISERCARTWCARPEFKRMVREHRRVVVDRVLGMHIRLAESAIETIGRLMKQAESETVKLQAAKGIIADLMNITNFAEIDERLSALERDHNARQQPGSTPCPGAGPRKFRA